MKRGLNVIDEEDEVVTKPKKKRQRRQISKEKFKDTVSIALSNFSSRISSNSIKSGSMSYTAMSADETEAARKYYLSVVNDENLSNHERTRMIFQDLAKPMKSNSKLKCSFDFNINNNATDEKNINDDASDFEEICSEASNFLDKIDSNDQKLNDGQDIDTLRMLQSKTTQVIAADNAHANQNINLEHTINNENKKNSKEDIDNNDNLDEKIIKFLEDDSESDSSESNSNSSDKKVAPEQDEIDEINDHDESAHLDAIQLIEDEDDSINISSNEKNTLSYAITRSKAGVDIDKITETDVQSTEWNIYENHSPCVLTIGRYDTCDITLRTSNEHNNTPQDVSRIQLFMFRMDDAIIMVDGWSFNGTRILSPSPQSIKQRKHIVWDPNDHDHDEDINNNNISQSDSKKFEQNGKCVVCNKNDVSTKYARNECGHCIFCESCFLEFTGTSRSKSKENQNEANDPQIQDIENKDLDVVTNKSAIENENDNENENTNDNENKKDDQTNQNKKVKKCWTFTKTEIDCPLCQLTQINTEHQDNNGPDSSLDTYPSDSEPYVTSYAKHRKIFAFNLDDTIHLQLGNKLHVVLNPKLDDIDLYE